MEFLKEEGLKTGDLIFVSGCDTAFSEAIIASQENPVQAYDHIGIIEKRLDGAIIWNANPELGVVAETLIDFRKREERTASRRYEVYRFKGKEAIKPAIDWIKQQEGLPYNWSFLKSEDSFYCADLIGRAFGQGVFPTLKMQFTGEFWDKHYKELGMEIPYGELGFHPAVMAGQENLLYLGAL